MQYQNVGVDQEGRLLYVQVPVTQTAPQTTHQELPTAMPQPHLPVAPRRKGRSLFEPFFVIQDGVISLSLKSLTVAGCLAISAALLGMLYVQCSNPDETLKDLDCT